jgi:rRNA processing protein Gar1
MNEIKQYLVAGIVVEAVKSPGGGFYEVTILQTGEKVRYLADVFEAVATPYIDLSNERIQ